MKYSPVNGTFCKNRKYIGRHWNNKYLRGIQCILLATHGVVGPKKTFFEKAFGRDLDEFKKILTLPELYTIYRNTHIQNGNRKKLDNIFHSLTSEQNNTLMNIILNNDFNNIEAQTDDKVILDILELYKLR